MTGFTFKGGSLTVGFDDALMLAGELVRAQWVALAQQHADTGRYAKSIRIAGVDTVGNGVFTVTLEGNAPYALAIEDGRQAFNLAEKIHWGATKGVRISKKGVPYIIIPLKGYAYRSPEESLRQGLSQSAQRQMMPQDVYEMAKALESSHFSGGKRTYVHYKNPAEGRTATADGDFTEPRDYRWGQRLKGLSAQHERKFGGMYRFGTGKQSTYTTFRTITPNSQWNIPAFAGYKMAEGALTLAADRAADVLAHALVEKIEAVIR